MFKSKEKVTTHKIDTLISQNTIIRGDIRFSGGLHVDGLIEGNVIAEDAASTMLTIGEKGRIEGEIHVPDVVINGEVVGNVFASQRVELAPNASVTGNVYYHLIKMMIGAKVNGNLIHQDEQNCLNDQTHTAVYIEGKKEELEHNDTVKIKV